MVHFWQVVVVVAVLAGIQTGAEAVLGWAEKLPGMQEEQLELDHWAH